MTSRNDSPRDEKKYNREDNPVLSELVANTESKHRSSSEVTEVLLRGLKILVYPGVFNPALSNVGDLLAEHMQIRPDDIVLDLGTGTGFQALVAARQGKKVYALDKQSEAIRCALKNVEINELNSKIEVIESDLFDSVPKGFKFDVILFNFPFVPWKAETPWQEANFDPDHVTLERFLNEARSHLSSRGRIFLTWAELGDTTYLNFLLSKFNYTSKTIAERSKGGIAHYVLELTLGGKG